MTDVVAAWERVVARVAAAAERAGRDPASVRIVAASKTVDAERIRPLLEAGCADLGENRAQELLAKAPALADLAPCWHFIGPLQRNKVRALAPWVTWWHTLDRDALIPELARRVPGARVLVEVNQAGEAQKAGCAPAEVATLVDVAREAGLEVVGLMSVPPAGLDPRPFFADLAARARDLGLTECSMGMSGDFEAAVEAGATIVRVGSLVFGGR